MFLAKPLEWLRGVLDAIPLREVSVGVKAVEFLVTGIDICVNIADFGVIVDEFCAVAVEFDVNVVEV